MLEAGAGKVMGWGWAASLGTAYFSDCRWELAWLERLWRGMERWLWGPGEEECRSDASASGF